MKSIKVSIYVVCAYLTVMCSASFCMESQLPQCIEKYCNQIPHLQHYEECFLENDQKATILTDYCCLFFPKRSNLSVNGKDELKKKFLQLMSQEKKIELLLLGFPFKSTNHEKKCLSANVDLGEYLSLVTLSTMICNMQRIYPNVHCTIISDGLAYHIDDYDPSYDEILCYHTAMQKLVGCFSHISFVSWKIHQDIESYCDVQTRVASVPLPSDAEFSKGYKKEMEAFVKEEFDCMFWNSRFLDEAKKDYDDSKQIMKEKAKMQEINRLKNELIKQKTVMVVEELGNKGKQFSTLVSELYPHYQESIRLSVHCNKNTVDVSKKIPISLIYGCNGTPWHNAVVINENEDAIMGLLKECHSRKKVFFSSLTKKSIELKINAQEHMQLEYIVN